MEDSTLHFYLKVKRGEKLACFKSFHKMTVYQLHEYLCKFYEKNQLEALIEGHHVFSAAFVNAIQENENLTITGIEEKYSINLDEQRNILNPLHRFGNSIFQNSSPMQYIETLSNLIAGRYLHYHHSLKPCFAKFSLCMVDEKIMSERTCYPKNQRVRIEQIGKIAMRIDKDLNNGNHNTIGAIASEFGLSEDDYRYCLIKNFFPKRWYELPLEIRDLRYSDN